MDDEVAKNVEDGNNTENTISSSLEADVEMLLVPVGGSVAAAEPALDVVAPAAVLPLCALPALPVCQSNKLFFAVDRF